MVLSRRELPNIGEYVVATVKEIHDFGAYVTLDEYNNMVAFLPWSEIASKWVKNIRDVIREGQKVVVKVIRVDKLKKEVDVSLKKVTDIDRRRKILWWKRYSKACKIIELVAQKLGKSIESAYREVIWKLEDKYGDVMYVLEEAVSSNRKILIDAGINEEWIEPIITEAQRHIKAKEAVVRAIIYLQSYSPDGVFKIRRFLENIAEYLRSLGVVKFRIYSAGAPRYIMEISSKDYKTTENILAQSMAIGEKVAKELGLFFKAERGKP